MKTPRLVLLAALALSPAASAEPLAVGVAPSAYLLPSGDWGFAPELLAQTYVPVAKDGWYLRPGGRLGMRGLVQDDMSTDLRIEERDVTLTGELGIVHGGRIVPSATLIAGIAHRSISLESEGVDVSMSRTSQSEWIPTIAGQLGLGLALHRQLMVEPFVRYEVLFTDARSHLRWGVEATISFGD